MDPVAERALEDAREHLEDCARSFSVSQTVSARERQRLADAALAYAEAVRVVSASRRTDWIGGQR